MIQRSFLRGGLIAAASLLVVLAPLTAQAVQAGDPAPDFTLTDTNGVAQTLSNHLGEVVYLFMVGYS